MVFAQYGDTMEFLREELRKDPDLRMRRSLKGTVDPTSPPADAHPPE